MDCDSAVWMRSSRLQIRTKDRPLCLCLVKIMELRFHGGDRDRLDVGSLDGNGMVPILQDAVHTKKFFAIDHNTLFLIKVGNHNRFMVTCALIADLYCPGYSAAEMLSKDANLMRTAVHYKVDASKIAARVDVELSSKRRVGRGERRDSRKPESKARFLKSYETDTK